jgi:aspartyl/glutamyl-tRNA(Asn/Gln) amidotransferase C subunit
MSKEIKTVIDDETLENVSILAKLDLSEAEKEQAKADMAEMLDYINTLNELDTEGVEPMSHTFDVVNVLREDVVTNGDGSALSLKNAPAEKEGMYQVPRTFDA